MAARWTSRSRRRLSILEVPAVIPALAEPTLDGSGVLSQVQADPALRRARR